MNYLRITIIIKSLCKNNCNPVIHHVNLPVLFVLLGVLFPDVLFSDVLLCVMSSGVRLSGVLLGVLLAGVLLGVLCRVVFRSENERNNIVSCSKYYNVGTCGYV